LARAWSRSYLEEIQCDAETLELVRAYMELIQKRASGELLTPAAWMRGFVKGHPEYQHDSVVPPAVAHDLVSTIAAIGEGRLQEPMLMGQQHVAPLRSDDAWPTPLTSPKIRGAERSALLARYANRGTHTHRDPTSAAE
jgi:glutamate--cysteine ligase catalytic subunit